MCLIDSEPHVSVRHAFIRQCSLPGFHIQNVKGLYCTSSFTAWDSYSALYIFVEKKKLAVDVRWNFSGKVFQMEHCLSMSWRSLPVLMEKISVARNMEKKKSCTLLAWTCFVFLLCILLFFVLSQYTVISQAKLKARAWMDLRGFLSRTLVPNGGLMSEILCVFQGSAGA